MISALERSPVSYPYGFRGLRTYGSSLFCFSSHEITKSNIINLSPQTLFEILSYNSKYLLSTFNMSKLSYMSLAIASGSTFLGGNCVTS